MPQLADGLFLTDGGLETTLIYERGMDLPAFASFDLLRTDAGTAELRRYYATYAQMANRYGTGFVLEAPTWRANKDWGQAYCYHVPQARTFSRTAADMVAAFTMNYVEEAIGVVVAAKMFRMPVAISFTVETDGRLPSGQLLADAIARTDKETDGYAAYYESDGRRRLLRHGSPACGRDLARAGGGGGGGGVVAVRCGPHLWGRPIKGGNMKLSRREFLQLTAGAAAASAISPTVWAQAYPSRPIRLVIPFPPGGAFDAVGRPWADKAKGSLGTLVVENIGGGGSSIGAAAVARAKPDGYTLLLGGTQTHVNEALLKTKPLYDPVKDLDAIAGVVAYPLCIAVHPSLPAKNLKELMALAKTNAGNLSYGHAGLGSIQHLAGELLKSLGGAPGIVQVPYRGTGPAITDLIGGQIPVAVLGLTGQIIELHRAGRMRVIAVTSPQRLKASPEFATAAESGFPKMVVRGSVGLLAPAGTPPAVIERVAQATRTALQDRAWLQMIAEAGMEPVSDPAPETFRKSLAADIALWAPVVKAVGVKVD